MRAEKDGARARVEFDVFRLFPEWSRKAARAVLPGRFVDALRRGLIHAFYERYRSTILREPKAVTFLRRRVLRSRPVLYHLDVHVTDHCNMRCKGCSHFSNISPKVFVDPATFERDFRRMAELFAGVKEVYLLGGEPLLHPRLADLIRVAHRCFPRAKTYVVTNSLLVTRMDASVWTALAETGVILYCDLYPVGLPVTEIDALAAAHGARIKWTEPRDQFFTIPIDVEGGQDAAASFAACEGVDNCVNLKDGRLYPCARIAYIDIFRERYGVDGLQATDADSMSIYGDVDGWQLMDFLLTPVPWCRHCDQEHLHFYDWERGDSSMEQWTARP